MAAIEAVLTCSKAGEHVVVSDNIYGGTYRLFTRCCRATASTFTYVDTAALGASSAAISPETKLLFVETPTNPMMKICDIARPAEIAHAHGVRWPSTTRS